MVVGDKTIHSLLAGYWEKKVSSEISEIRPNRPTSNVHRTRLALSANQNRSRFSIVQDSISHEIKIRTRFESRSKKLSYTGPPRPGPARECDQWFETSESK